MRPLFVGLVGALAVQPFVAGAPVAAQSSSANGDAPGPILADASVFWLTADDEDRAAARDRLVAYDVPVATLYDAMGTAPRYPDDAPRGRLDRAHRNVDGTVHPYTVVVPEAYSPDRDWPVLVWLHGGIGRPAFSAPGEWWQDYERIADPDRIVVVPASWNESRWWQDSQVESLGAILATLGREYRVDRNRVHMLGVSDGATGAFYHAFRAQTSWASFLAFIGHAAVLSNPRLGVDGQMYVSNLRNRPIFIVNGGRDRLYPTSSVQPFIDLFRANDVPFVYRPKPNAGHDLTWMPEEAARIDSFVVATRREPFPEKVEWETEDPSVGRMAWIEIGRIGNVEGESDLPGRNDLTVDGQSGQYLAFPHRLPSGRIEAVRDGNTVRVKTEGVAAFRVLVSPEAFDLARPVRVEANGRTVYDGIVEASARTLLSRAEADRDRGMLFVAEIEVDLAR